MTDSLRLLNTLILLPIAFLLAIFPACGQTKKEIVFVLGSINNKTMKSEYDKLNIALYRSLNDHPLFPQTILDTMLLIDSVPDEFSILSSRDADASFILWGEVDTSEYGFNVTLKIFDMYQASTAHIGMMLQGNEKKDEIAQILQSKLLMWLRRTTMVQLIISTTPGSATVFLDSKEIGTTPFEGMVQPGTFSLELTKRSFSPIKMPVSLISGNTYQYDFTLGKNDSGNYKDKRSVKRLITVSLLCAGAGAGAHYFQQRSMREYRAALPPSEFNRLYRKAVIWNIGRNTLLTAAGVAMSGMILKVVL